MSRRKKPEPNPWAGILQFLLIDMPWGLATLMVYLLGISIAMLSIVVILKLIIAVLVGFSNNIPFHVM